MIITTEEHEVLVYRSYWLGARDIGTLLSIIFFTLGLVTMNFMQQDSINEKRLELQKEIDEQRKVNYIKGL